MIKLFAYLQLLDLLTTVIALRFPGMAEMSPVVSRLIPTMGVFAAVLASKLFCAGVILLASLYHKEWAIRKAVYIYAAVVASNLVQILMEQKVIA